MRWIFAAPCLIAALACSAGARRNGQSSGGSSSGGANGCLGAVTVTQGLLAGGAPGQATAASAFFSYETRLALASSDCGYPPDGGYASTLTLELPVGLGPGTYSYPFPADAGSPFQLFYSYATPLQSAQITGAQSGTLTLTAVSPGEGLQGSYSFDFGELGVSGCDSQYGCVSLGDVREVGSFVAPICALCGQEPPFDAGPLPQFGDAGLAACDDYYAAQYTRCGGPTPPPSFKARFDQVCQNQMTLEGSGMTPAAVEACVAALDVSPCDWLYPPPQKCIFHGALPSGASCTDGMQCQSANCAGTQPGNLDGPTGPMTCGACFPGTFVAGPEAAAGEVCDNGGCGPGLYCSPPPPSCPPVQDAGPPCSGSQPPSVCLPLEDAGAPCCCLGICAGPGWCGPGNWCVSTPDGGPCTFDQECYPGLTCIAGSCSPSVAWANAGEPCNAAVHCIFGTCSSTNSPPDGGWAGTCPTFIADGQPCTVTFSGND